MQSKKLPFNKNLLQKDWKLVQWIFYSFLGLMIIAVPYFIGQQASSFLTEAQSQYNNIYRLRTIFRIENQVVLMAVGVVPVILATLLVGEEKRKKTLEIMIAGPYTRFEIFFNKVFLGVFIITIPIIVSGLILMGMRFFSPLLLSLYTGVDIIAWIISYSIIGVSVFSFSILIGILMGSSLGQFICSYIFIFFPVAFYGLFLVSYNKFYTLINGNHVPYDNAVNRAAEIFGQITPMFFFYQAINLSPEIQIFHSTLLLLISISIIMVSHVLFDLSKMEKNSELLTFESTEGFFRFGILICSILLGGAIIGGIIDRGISGMLIGYLVGGYAGYKVPKYLIQKNRAA